LVFDPALGPGAEAPAALSGLAAPWELLASGGEVVVLAVAVTALEPLATFHERVEETSKGLKGGPGRLLPEAWEARRREARERGVGLAPAALAPLRRWAERFAVEFPDRSAAQP
jgi:hypothetical protein